MKTVNVLLVDPNFIRATTNISNNMNDKYLHSAIRESTDIDLEEIYGSKLLEKVKDLVASGEIQNDENEKYKELLDKSKYFLAYSSISRIVVISSAKIDSMGVNTADDDHVDSLDLKEIFQLEKYYRNKADYYKKKLQLYLQENYKNLPELYDCNLYGIDSNTYSAASTGIWLGGIRGKSYNPVTRLADKYENSNIA